MVLNKVKRYYSSSLIQFFLIGALCNFLYPSFPSSMIFVIVTTSHKNLTTVGKALNLFLYFFKTEIESCHCFNLLCWPWYWWRWYICVWWCKEWHISPPGSQFYYYHYYYITLQFLFCWGVGVGSCKCISEISLPLCVCITLSVHTLSL